MLLSPTWIIFLRKLGPPLLTQLQNLRKYNVKIIISSTIFQDVKLVSTSEAHGIAVECRSRWRGCG